MSGIWGDGAATVPVDKAGAWAAAKHIPPMKYDYQELYRQTGSHARARALMANLRSEDVLRKQNGAERLILATSLKQQGELARRRENTQGFALARAAPVARAASLIKFQPPAARVQPEADARRKAARTRQEFIVDQAVRKAFTTRRLMLGGHALTQRSLSKLGNTMFIQVQAADVS